MAHGKLRAHQSGFTGRDLDRKDKMLKALDMRKMGFSFPEIAKELGYKTPSGAYMAVNRMLKQAIRERGEELVDLYLQRLDFMLNRLQRRIIAGEPRAIEVALKIEERRAKLLGLDAAERVEHSFDGPITIEYYRDERQGEVIDITPERPQLPAARSSDSSDGIEEEDHGDSWRDGEWKDVDSAALGEKEASG